MYTSVFHANSENDTWQVKVVLGIASVLENYRECDVIR